MRRPALLPKWGPVDQIMTSRPGSCTGSNRSTSWSSSVKTAVFAPMPSASDRTAMVVTTDSSGIGARRSVRRAKASRATESFAFLSGPRAAKSMLPNWRRRRRVGIAGRHAPPNVSLRQQAQVRAHLVVEFTIRVSLAEQPFQFRRQDAEPGKHGRFSCGHRIEDSMNPMECP